MTLDTPFASFGSFACSHPPTPERPNHEPEPRLHRVRRLRLQRLRTLTDRADDTALALGSDIMSASCDGYALAKVGGKGTALDTLNEAMQTRLSRKPHTPPDTPAA